MDPDHPSHPDHIQIKNKSPSIVTMGGKLSRAKRACMTDKSTSVNASGDITGSSLGAGVTVTKSYDTGCVQSMLSK